MPDWPGEKEIRK